MALVERLAIMIDANAQGAISEFHKLSGAASKTDTNLTNVQKTSGALKGALSTIGIAGAAAAIGTFAGQSLKAASALEEVEAKAKVVFGSSFPEIERFATDTADALNLSERAAYEATSTFGQMFKAAGFEGSDLAKQSAAAAALAADLESFNNFAPGEGMQKLMSGLSGEAEPLRVAGVFLSDAKIKAQAYEDGIAKVGAELTEGEKIQARWNFILGETVDAQGDAARTAGSYANTQRDLAENVEELQVAFGRRLTPAVGDATGALADFIEMANGAVDSTGGDASLLTTNLYDQAKALEGLLGVAFDPQFNPEGGIISVGDAWATAVAQARGELEQVPGPADAAYTSLYDMGQGADQAAGATGGLVDKVAAIRGSTEDATSAIVPFNDATDDIRVKAEAADEKIRGLTDALDAMSTPFLDVRDAQREFEAALDAVDAAIAENGTTLDITTEAGRNNQAALDGVAGAAWGVLNAQAEAGASSADLQTKMTEIQGPLAEAQGKFGEAAGAAGDLATQAGLIPSNVPIYVQAYGLWETLGALERVQYLLSLVGATNASQVYSLSGVGPGFTERPRASGGPVGDGMYLVGEKGPELLSLRGTTGQVYSNAKTRTMLDGGGTGVYIANQTVVAQDYDDFVRQMERDQALLSMPGVRA